MAQPTEGNKRSQKERDIDSAHFPRSYTPTPLFPMPDKENKDLLVYLNECLHVHEAQTLYYKERINSLLKETDDYVEEHPECSPDQLTHLDELEKLYWELNLVLKATNSCLKRQQVQLLLEPFRHCISDKF